jgi:hypothetical protein
MTLEESVEKYFFNFSIFQFRYTNLHEIYLNMLNHDHGISIC